MLEMPSKITITLAVPSITQPNGIPTEYKGFDDTYTIDIELPSSDLLLDPKRLLARYFEPAVANLLTLRDVDLNGEYPDEYDDDFIEEEIGE